MLSFDIILPVGRPQYVGNVLANLAANTSLPDHIFLVDNSEGLAVAAICEDIAGRLPIIYLKQDKNIGINASWNLGLEVTPADLLLYLNDDVILCNYFIEKIRGVFEQNESAGYVVPNTIGSPAEVRKTPDSGLNRVVHQPTREGWAFTVRTSALAGTAPIPKEIFNFCGDDYLFDLIVKQGFETLRAVDVPVHHMTVGISFQSIHDPAEKAKAQLDVKAWAKLVHEGRA